MGKLLFLMVSVLTFFSANAAKKEKKEDPRMCEVCIANLEAIDALVPADKKSDKLVIREAIGKRCTKSGFGSEWKPNPELTSPKDVKMCYYFEPIKEAITTPFATGMPKEKVCRRLMKENPEIVK